MLELVVEGMLMMRKRVDPDRRWFVGFKSVVVVDAIISVDVVDQKDIDVD